MSSLDFRELFDGFDHVSPKVGFVHAIDAAVAVNRKLAEIVSKVADYDLPGSKADPELKGSRAIRVAGALGQLWESPELANMGIPQHPSSLGQMLVLGGLGALTGYGVGRLAEKVIPENDVFKARRAGAWLGGLAGMTPGLLSAYFNAFQGKPLLTSSFYEDKTAEFRSQFNPAVAPINVNAFHNAMWNDPTLAPEIPLHVRAGASGLVQGAANLPGRRNSYFVTPFDIARMSVGMGSGLASGWLVGKALGAVFGTGQASQRLLRNAGVAAGVLKTVVPMAYGSEPYGY